MYPASSPAPEGQAELVEIPLDPRPVSSPAIPPAGELTDPPPSEYEASLSLVAQLRAEIDKLRIRIEAADTHLMRISHLYDIGSSIVANTPGNWPGRDALEWVFDLQSERIAWARETLITADERESDTFSQSRRRLLAPQSILED